MFDSRHFPKVFGRLAIPYQSFKELYKFNPKVDLWRLFVFPNGAAKVLLFFSMSRKILIIFLGISQRLYFSQNGAAKVLLLFLKSSRKINFFSTLLRSVFTSFRTGLQMYNHFCLPVKQFFKKFLAPHNTVTVFQNGTANVGASPPSCQA